MSSRTRKGARRPGPRADSHPAHGGSMPLGRGPRTLKAELQFRFLVVGSVFLVVAPAPLYVNGTGSLRRQVLTNAATASETAASLIAVEDHRLVRTAADMNSQAFRTIVTNLGALRRANPSIYHLFTLAPGTRLGAWGVVVDLGSTGN